MPRGKKLHKSKKAHHVTKPMHYATLIALVISNLTVLALAMLFTNDFSSGLGYFEQMRQEALFRTANARELGTDSADRRMTTAGFLKPSLHMRRATYYGTVTYVNDEYGVLTSDIRAGAPLVATTVFGDEQLYGGVEGAEWGEYDTSGFAMVAAGQRLWNTGLSRFVVHNAPPSPEYVAIQNYDYDYEPNSFYLLAQASWENSVDVIDSNGIPSGLAVDTDSANEFEFNLYYNPNYIPSLGPSWSIVGTVDRVEFQ